MNVVPAQDVVRPPQINAASHPTRFFSMERKTLSVTDYASEFSRHQRTSRSMLDGARAGESDAWSQLAFIYAPMIASWGQRHGISKDDLDDFVQNVFAFVVLSLPHYTPDEERFRNWLLRVVRDRADDFMRQVSLEIPMDDEGRLTHEAGTSDPDDSEDSRTIILLRACELIRTEFSPRTFEMFLRTALHGEDTGAVAIDLGLSSAAVRQAKSRVTRRLRDVLADEFH